jgi:hypothetical protein
VNEEQVGHAVTEGVQSETRPALGSMRAILVPAFHSKILNFLFLIALAPINRNHSIASEEMEDVDEQAKKGSILGLAYEDNSNERISCAILSFSNEDPSYDITNQNTLFRKLQRAMSTDR